MTELAGAIARTAPQPDGPQPVTFRHVLERQKDEIARALPRSMDADRFLRLVLTEVKRTPKLTECTIESVLGGLMLAAQLGLEPGGVLGQCYLIPRRVRGTQTATFQLGYRGLTDLAARNGWIVTSSTVHKGDVFEWQDGTDPHLLHRAEAWGTEATHYWAVARKDGYPATFTVWPAARVAQHRDRFADKTSPAWAEHFDAMAEKTVIADLARTLQLSPEAERAVRLDGQVIPTLTPQIADDHVIDTDIWEAPEPVEPAEPSGGYKSQRVAELRIACEQRGLTSTGDKATLVARLEADDEGYEYDDDPEPDGDGGES